MLIQCFLICSPAKGLFDDWSQVSTSASDQLSGAYYDYSTSQVYRELCDHLGREIVLSPEAGDQACAGVQLNVETNSLIIHEEADQRDHDSILDFPDHGHRYLFFDPCYSENIANKYTDGFVVTQPNIAKRFERISEKEYAELFANSLDNLSSLISYNSCFAKACWKASSRNLGSVVKLARSASPVHGTVSGWIRPFIIRLSLDGDHYNNHFEKGKKSAPNALHKLLKSEALKYVQPIVARTSDARWSLFQKWWDEIRQRGEDLAASHLTAVERLVFRPCIENPPFQDGMSVDSPWYPFFILDHLGGSFHVTGFGKGNPEFSWCPPSTMPKNLEWFAEYWVDRWGGKLEDSDKLRGESFGAPRLPRVKRRLGKGVQDENATYANSVVKTLGDHPASDDLGELKTFLVKVFSSHELQGTAEFEKLHRDSIRTVEKQLHFYPKLFVESACRSALLPASPIRIQPPFLDTDIFVERRIPDNLEPHVKYENDLVGQKAFDIIEDSGGGAEAFLRRIITANPQDWDTKSTIVPFPMVWWLGKWANLATSAPSNVMFYLKAITTNPFVLADPNSLLGDANSLLGDANLDQSSWTAKPAHNVNIFYT